MYFLAKKIGAFFSGIADRLLSILGAIIMAQFPQFFSQYLQRLGGHLNEARRTVNSYEQAAEALGIGFDEYIAAHLKAEERLFQASGEVLVSLVERLEALETSFSNLQQAGPFTRWVVFFQEVDWDIARQSLFYYTPGIPTSLEGIIYALTGLLLGWGFFSLLKTSFYSIDSKLKNKKKKRV